MGFPVEPCTVESQNSLNMSEFPTEQAIASKSYLEVCKGVVEIAKAILHSPRVLLLDEPTSGLDVTARRQLNDYLRVLVDTENILVLLTTHLLDDAEAAIGSVSWITENLVALGTPDELRAQVGGDICL